MAENEKTDTETDFTSINMFVFVVITILYYAFLKPKFKIADMVSEKTLTAVITNQNYMTGIYFLVVVLSQFIINMIYLASRCGGDIASNLGASAMLTFLPWLFVFGILMMVLMAFPGMKSGFSDVLGYLAVSRSANRVVTELLLDPEVDSSLNMENADDASREKMQGTASTIVKILGNMSILINQVVPANFSKFWASMTPLMKPRYRDNLEGAETFEIKQKLLDLATLRDNMGEACWYIYTGIFTIFLVQYNLISHRCSVDPKVMDAKFKEFEEKKKQEEEQKKKENTTTYVLE